MSLMDTVKQMMGAGGGGEGGGMFNAVQALIQKSGGLNGLLQKFNASGLQGAVKSWIGLGKNEDVTGDQVESAVGTDQIAEIAAKLGIDKETAKAKLAEILPKVVDKLTPAGEVPQEGVVGQALSALKNLFH